MAGLEDLEGLAPLPGMPAPCAIPAEQVHTILFTSGTTGRPRGVQLTHGNHFASAVASLLNLGLELGDRWIAALPLFHVGGQAIAIRAAIYGIGVDLHAGFDAARVNAAIDAGGTLLSVVAVMLQRCFEARGARPYPASFRAALLGGGPAPRPLLRPPQRRPRPPV